MESINNWVNKLLVAYPDKTERIVYLFIFLFPIAGMSVRHWISNIFNILVLIGLFTLKKPREPLLKQEKIFLWICVAYFSMFIISSFANEWTKIQTYYLGTEMRFLFVIPLYLLIRRYEDSSFWLLRGALVGGFFLFGQAFYDVIIRDLPTAIGVYSKNIIGPFAVLIVYYGIYLFLQNFKIYKWQHLLLIFLSVIAALFAASMSGSRGSYVGFAVTGFASVLFFSKPRWMFAALFTISIIIVLFYQSSSIVKPGVDTAVNEVEQYLAAEDHVKDLSSTTPAGVRLEMFRTTMLFIKDNLFVGIGPGNYRSRTLSYVKEAKVHQAVAEYSHPHNSFIEVASAKGILGLITLLLLFYYPAYIYIKNYKTCKPTAVIGLIHIVAISAFALSDHSLVLMNNYTSIILLGMIIFLSSHIRSCRDHIK